VVSRSDPPAVTVAGGLASAVAGIWLGSRLMPRMTDGFCQGWNHVFFFLLPSKYLKTHVSLTKTYYHKILLSAIMILSAFLA